MTEEFKSVSGGSHPCYLFYLRMRSCMQREINFRMMCAEETEDYWECKLHKKQDAFDSIMNQKLHKQRIYSLPVYNEKTDTFSDGPLPLDMDAYFTKPLDQQNYYK